MDPMDSQEPSAPLDLLVPKESPAGWERSVCQESMESPAEMANPVQLDPKDRQETQAAMASLDSAERLEAMEARETMPTIVLAHPSLAEAAAADQAPTLHHASTLLQADLSTATPHLHLRTTDPHRPSPLAMTSPPNTSQLLRPMRPPHLQPLREDTEEEESTSKLKIAISIFILFLQRNTDRKSVV